MSRVEVITGGAISGFIATLAMSGWMLVADYFG
jgi:hypothetical protein